MAVCTLRFDFRNPEFARTSMADRYQAALEMTERAKRTEETVQTLRKAWTGEPFEFRGRTVRVTPTPTRPGGPPIFMGGSTEPAARRAARLGDGFIASVPEIWEYYRDECIKVGK